VLELEGVAVELRGSTKQQRTRQVAAATDEVNLKATHFWHLTYGGWKLKE
jgi:hypothetical protein